MMKLAIISHRMGFESTISLFKETFKRFLIFFWNCVIEDTLINFLGVILIENAPKRKILCVRENPALMLQL